MAIKRISDYPVFTAAESATGDKFLMEDVSATGPDGNPGAFKAMTRAELALAMVAENAFVAKAGDTMTGQLNFSGTTHAGVKLNSLTTTQKNALTAAAGMVIYDSTLTRPSFYESGAWREHVRLAGDTMTGDLKFTDASYDIGKSGATRPRHVYASGNVTFGGVSLAADGAYTAPGYSFGSETGTGFYRDAANKVVFATNGHKVAMVADQALRMNGNGQIGWTSSGSDPTGSQAVGFYFPTSGLVSLDGSVAGDAAAALGLTKLVGGAAFSSSYPMWKRNGAAWNARLGDDSAAAAITAGAAQLSGHLTFSADATYDIGASGATRARNLFLSGSITAGSTISSNGNNAQINGIRFNDGGGNRGYLISAGSDGKFRWLTEGGGNIGALIDIATADTIKFRSKADAADASLYAGYGGFSGELNVGGGSALATNATTGFLLVGSMAGAPSGTPSSAAAGKIPHVVDTTNGRAYWYYGGAWHYVALT